MSVEATLDELVRCSGSQFDPDVVAPLVALIRAGFDASASARAPLTVDRSLFADS